MQKLKLHSPDLTQANIDKLAAIADLFPNCITESRSAGGQLQHSVDFDQLRQELSGSLVEGPQERYQLNWPGKREALLTAKTLRPCRAEKQPDMLNITMILIATNPIGTGARGLFCIENLCA